MKQIAVRRVKLDTVKTGGHGILSRTTKIADDGLDLVTRQRLRGDGVRLVGWRKHLPFRVERRRCHRRLAVMEFRQRKAAAMPELANDQAAFAVHGRSDSAPAGNLRSGPDARCVRIATGLRRNDGAFGDDQAGTGALGVIQGRQSARYKARVIGTATRQRGHDNAVP